MNSTPYPISLQPLLFSHDDLSGCFFSPLTKKEEEFMGMWNALVAMMPVQVRLDSGRGRTGRHGYPLLSVLAVIAVKLAFSLRTMRAAIGMLEGSANLRTITGMAGVPSASVVARKTRDLIGLIDFEGIKDRLCSSFYRDRLVCHLSIDSTIVEARERAAKKEGADRRGKRGRPKAGSDEERAIRERKEKEEEEERLMKEGDTAQFVSRLEHRCTAAGKKSSKGHMQWFVGYKAHLAVDDNGIPVASAVTGAGVHDSRLAIPLMRMAERRCTYLYALMDGGYTSKEIEGFAASMGKVPIIDRHADRNGHKEAMDPAAAFRYRARSAVERANGELKECFLPDKLYSRNARAVFQIEMAILMLTIKRMALVIKREEGAGKAS